MLPSPVQAAEPKKVEKSTHFELLACWEKSRRTLHAGTLGGAQGYYYILLSRSLCLILQGDVDRNTESMAGRLRILDLNRFFFVPCPDCISCSW
jgi:hypothetical protein